MTTLITRWLTYWFPVEELRGDQMRRLIEERKRELYAQWNAGLIHPLQSSAPTVRESVNVS